MSRKNNLSRNFRRLAAEKKIILVSASVTFISCFLPWYGSNSRLLINRIDWNAFDNIGSVAGYIISSFALITLSMVALPLVFDGLNLSKKMPFRESSILLFLSAQSAFVSLLFVAIYSQYALVQSANSSTRFGLYMTLVSALVTAVASLTLMQKEKRLPEETVEMEAENISENSFVEEGEYEEQEVVAEAELAHRPLQQSQTGWGQEESEVLEETAYDAPISESQYSNHNQNELVESFEKASTWERPPQMRGAESSSSTDPLQEDTIDF